MSHFGGATSTGRLRSVLVCSPGSAGWMDPTVADAWGSLGFLAPPDAARAQGEHDALVAVLRSLRVTVHELTDTTPDLDGVYVHDASFLTPEGAVLLRPGKPNRRGEPNAHAAALERLGIPLIGGIHSPGTVEGGDLVWLDARTVLAGRSYRTNAAGIDQLGMLLRAQGVTVESVPLPHAGGPSECLHLMSLVSPLDATTWLVDREWLSVQTLERLAGAGLTLLDIDADERATLAANVLAIGDGDLVMFAGNPNTRQRLVDHGFGVHEVPGQHIGVHGAGGPTCLTRPLHRDDV